MAHMTPEEGRAYLERWALAQEVELSELRRTPLSLKLKQLSALMASRHVFAADADRERQIQVVRARWQLLRQALGG